MIKIRRSLFIFLRFAAKLLIREIQYSRKKSNLQKMICSYQNTLS